MKEVLANRHEVECKQISVDEYRENNHRCRTCKFAHDKIDYERWLCIAKNKLYYGYVTQAVIKGIFCPLYKPMEYKDGE